MSQQTNRIQPSKLDAKSAMDFRIYGKYIAFLRRHPTHAARILFGIKVPPHESVILENCWLNYSEYHIQCSRATSKTFVVGSLDSPLRSLLFANVSILNASGSKFRGGKMILKDSANLLQGRLRGQRLPGKWGMGSLQHTNAIKKEPDIWTIEFESNSKVMTIPTNNDESVRGIRATTLKIDERNLFSQDTIKKVYKPFILVGTNFENPGQGTKDNQVFYVGTIDYSYRDWYKELMSTQDIIRSQYAMTQALHKGDWEAYNRTLSDKNKNRVMDTMISYLRFDYTDLLIPTTIGKYKVNYPGAREGKDIVWDNRDQKEYIYTYPLNKAQAEQDLDEGLVDADSWYAEHRNVFIEVAGNVYPPSLIEKVTDVIFSEEEELKKGWDQKRIGKRYFAPILYSCSDPCILGVDTARTADFAAFVIIRIGEAPADNFPTKDSPYSLQTHSGMSPWNNVIWAEQHQKMTMEEIAAKIRELRKRYNIIHTRECPGISMDARGGGTTVRDELAKPSAELGQAVPQIIFDPEDPEYKHLLADVSAWPGLRLLWTTEQDNHELVGFSKAQMESTKIYIPPYLDRSSRQDPDNLLLAGYMGIRTLKEQLLRVQAKLSPSGNSVKYDVPGNKSRIENKKDMFMAFLYACNSLRLFLNLFKKPSNNVPVAYGTVIELHSRFKR